jgi:hypothetical protein
MGVHEEGKIRGQDKRTRGQEDKRTRGQEDKRTRGQEDKRTRGQEDKRTNLSEKKFMMWTVANSRPFACST